MALDLVSPMRSGISLCTLCGIMQICVQKTQRSKSGLQVAVHKQKMTLQTDCELLSYEMRSEKPF